MSSTTHPVEKHEAQLERHERTLTAHEERIQEIEKSIAANDVRMKQFYESIGAIKALIANIDNKIDKIFGDLSARITNLEQADARKWQKFTMTIALAIGTGIVGYLLGVFFK